MATFDLLPAIDLRGGRVVRLRQGDFARETAYSDDPVEVVNRFVDGGARWFHVVDLDGARAGEPRQTSAVQAILDAVAGRAAVEVAGGFRTRDAVDGALAQGAARVVVGSAALADPGFAGDLVERHGRDRIAIALDVRGGQAIGQAWQTGAAGIELGSAIERLCDAGARWLEVTAIERDGSLGGPDVELLEAALARAGDARVIASGGIASADDLRAVREMGCAGAIVGRALYDGTLSLEAALASLSRA